MHKKYGTSNFVSFMNQSPAYIELLEASRVKGREATNIKYGVKNPGQIPAVKRKVRATCLKKYGVPHILALSKQSMVSNGGNDWLDALGILVREKWLHINGETFCVDGFDPDTNTVYEFYGVYWHGHPGLFDSKLVHPQILKTMGSIYKETIDRYNLIIKAKYNFVFVWEDDFVAGILESASWPHERGGG